MYKKPTYEELEQRIRKLERDRGDHYPRQDSYREIFEAAKDTFLIFDMNGVIKDVNSAASIMYGYSRNEMIGLPGKDIVDPDFQYLFKEFVKKASEGLIFSAESVDIRKDGASFPVEMRGSGLVYKGKPHLLAVVRDVTERKQAEEALRAERERFRFLSQNAPFGMAMIAKDGTFKYVNPKFIEIFGYGLSDTPDGRTWFRKAYPDPDYRRQVISAWLEDLAYSQVGQKRPRVFKVECKDGSKKIVNFIPVQLETDENLMACEDITGRKRAEEALRESEDRHRSVLDTINEGVILQSASGEILTWNKTAENIFGIPSDSAIGKTSEGKDWLTIHEDGSKYEGNDHPSMRTLRTGKPCADEIMGVYQPSGNLCWISVNTNPLFSENSDRPYAVAISFSDITELRQAMEALRESEKNYRDIFENSSDTIFIHDAKTGAILDVNKTTCDIFGYAYKELKLLDVGDLSVNIPPFTKTEAVQWIHRAMEEGPQQFEWVAKDRNGKLIWFENSLLHAKIAGKDRILVFGRNIDDRKRAEKALKESESKFREMVESINEVIYSTNENGMVTYISPVVKNFLGYDPSEIIGKEFKNFIHKDDLNYVLEKYAKIISGNLEPSEYRLLAKSGALHWIRSSRKPIFEGNRFIGLRGAFSDISESKKLEEHLRQSQKMEAIGTLAGGIAHEFNNVLGIILGNAELALDDVPDWNPAKESLKEIRTASFRAKEVVRQILSFARKTMMSLKPLEINTIVKESLKLMRASIPTMVDIQPKIPSGQSMILGDPTEIHQIVINLCTNAAHAMKKAGGVLEVGLSEMSLNEKDAFRYEDLLPGDFVRLTVKDSGEGIPPDILEKVFEPYFTTKEFGAGSGMGLAVVYGIVKKCKGAIKIDSDVGQGTTVEVFFPKIEEEAPAKEKKEVEMPKGNERILLVDDDPSIVNMICQMLERFGYTVTSMTDSTTALERFKSAPDDFDLVITDMSMPKMSGDQLAAELIKIRKGVPILLCTGHSDAVDEKKARQIGIKGFAMKPLDMGKLANAVRAVLDDR